MPSMPPSGLPSPWKTSSRLEGEIGRVERVTVAGKALGIGLAAVPIAEVGDAPVSEIDQVPGSG